VVLLERTVQVFALFAAACMEQAGETSADWLAGRVMFMMAVTVGNRGV